MVKRSALALFALFALPAFAQSVEDAEPDGTTALQLAAHRNDLPAVRRLLKAGANVRAVNRYGVTALSEAASAGNAEMVSALLAAGASAETVSPEGESVLMTASRAGAAAAVRLLIERGAEVNRQERWKGQTALMWASAGNHAQTIRVLLEHGAGLNTRSALVTPETKYPANGNLVSEQPKGSLTALLFAARAGALDAVQVLVRAGADLNLAEPDGITPLLIAIINGHYDVAGFLISSGGSVSAADRWGRTPLYAAVDMHTLEPSSTRPPPETTTRLTPLEVAGLLLAKGAAPNPRLSDATPGRGIPDPPDAILRAGATPFLRAAKTGDVAAMRLLLKYGADPKLATDGGVTALMAAAGQGWRFGDSQIPEANALEAVKLCAELGLDVNAANQKKETALHGAADRGADRIVQYLASRHARLDVVDEKGRTPLAIAAGTEGRGHPAYPTTAALLKRLITNASEN